MSQRFDVVVIGAGAAGMYCAAQLGRRGLHVALVEHWPKLAEKIRISGGGRCNFTNLQADRLERYSGEDPAFARNALRALPPARFIEQLRRRGIDYHEKHKGQLFCDDSSERIIAMLRDDCDEAGVRWFRPVAVHAVESAGSSPQSVASGPGRPGSDASGGHPGRGPLRFVVRTQAGDLRAASVVVATGGLAIPKIGASDFGLRVARRFGLRVVEPRPALVPLTFDARAWRPFAELAGLALPVVIGVQPSMPDARVVGVAPRPAVAAPRPAVTAPRPVAPSFDEDLLFTHRGLSGPAVLQISTFWRHGEALTIDLAGGRDLEAALLAGKRSSRQQLASVLGAQLPRRLAVRWLAEARFAELGRRRLAEVADRDLAALAAALRDWRIVPAGTEGYRKAEVMAGGVATDELDPRSLASRRVPGLHFIGEVVDVTGWLGGYNFQWAWSSAYLAAQAIAADSARGAG
ncbi:MAG: FAD-dependent oxidoreductase [Limnobacter sp.]|nr:FAD-dependent oxidoreductase [Limnobacter sp.]